MFTETDFWDYSKPVKNNLHEFIVCLPGSEQLFYCYADLKNVVVQLDHDKDSEIIPPVFWKFPNISTSNNDFDIFHDQLNCGKKPVCIFIDISTYLENDNSENQNRLQSLFEFFKNQKEIVFTVIVYTDEIREARSLYEKFFISDFIWSVFEDGVEKVEQLLRNSDYSSLEDDLYFQTDAETEDVFKEDERIHKHTDIKVFSTPYFCPINEFIVCSPSDMDAFDCYSHLKNESVNFDKATDSDFPPSVFLVFPAVSASLNEFDDFYRKIINQKSANCFFIDISSYLHSDPTGMKKLYTLGNFIANSTNFVFSLVIFTDEFFYARRLYEKFRYGELFIRRDLRNLPLEAELVAQMEDQNLLHKNKKGMFDYQIAKVQSDLHQKIIESTMQKSKKYEAFKNNGSIGHIVSSKTNEDKIKSEENDQKLSKRLYRSNSKLSINPLFAALESAFIGDFDRSFQELYKNNQDSWLEKIACAFFNRYALKEYEIPKNPTEIIGGSISYISFYLQHPIALALLAFEKLDARNYTGAFAMLQLLDQKGWEQIAYVWQTLLWNNTVHHPDAALICTFANLLNIYYFQDYDEAFARIIPEHYGKLGNDNPYNLIQPDSNILDYFKYYMRKGGVVRRLYSEIRENILSNKSNLLTGFAGEIYYFSLFSDLVCKNYNDNNEYDMNFITNVEKALDLYSRIRFRIRV